MLVTNIIAFIKKLGEYMRINFWCHFQYFLHNKKEKHSTKIVSLANDHQKKCIKNIHQFD